MAVPKSKQNDTKIKFLSMAYDIANYTYRLALKLPNKHKKIADKLIDESVCLYSKLKEVNLIYPLSYNDAKKRRKGFKKCRYKIQVISSCGF